MVRKLRRNETRERYIIEEERSTEIQRKIKERYGEIVVVLHFQVTIAPLSSWDILIKERELIHIRDTAQAPESHL